MRKRLSTFFIVTAFVVAASGSAFAADMTINALPPAPASAYDWTGWYVGGNVGYSWGNARTDTAGSAITLGGGPSFPNSVAFANSLTQPLTGVIGGGEAGYNYQVGSQWVVGFEADIQGSAEQGSSNFGDPFSGTICSAAASPTVCSGGFVPLKGTAVSFYQAKIEWFGTVRGRVGVLIDGGGLLLYGTGGLAYGQVSFSGNLTVNAAAPAVPVSFGPNTSAFSQAKTNFGFAAGGGMEGRVVPTNWTWKLEYLFLDLGSLNTSTSLNVASSSLSFSPLAGTMTTHSKFIDNIFRVGVNYQFH